ncbi:hypothetical protein M655_023265 [Brevibacillus sp. NSP2.1]|uniref:hypothetical protein n=1 Tax=Brevibacillus sp. NSP2.1 TaxID=3003229 RepID=UPI0004115390|nr:hypothetical protein [Brevibacillus sp. NSP2.1]QHZ58326.1 hypothetical protein M655_023265 [Brevibacillus sp. NSP2.1]
MNTFASVSMLETDKPIRKASPDLDPHIEMYKLYLTSEEAVEIHISNLTHPSSAIEVYDVHGTKLSEARFAPGGSIILPFFPDEDGFYYIKLTIGPDPDPQHACQLHVDKYVRLSGTIESDRVFTAKGGPYLIGPEDTTILAGVRVSFEAGTSINVRCQHKLIVEDSGSIAFNGEADNPVVIIGAIDNGSSHRWSQLVLSPSAQTSFTHILVQYDNDEDGVDFLASSSPFADGATSLEQFQADIAKTSYLERAVVVPPSSRLAFIKTWFQQSSPYRFSLFGDLLPFELYFGIDVATFAHWEAETKRIDEQRSQAGDVNYWDFVNGNFTADLLEATHLFANNQQSPELRIQRLIDFLLLAQSWRKKHGYFKWYDLIDPFNEHDDEFFKTFEEMSSAFWLAHNTSIIYWDTIARDLGIWQKESFFERQFINSVIVRLHFAADLPFSLTGYGNNIPPVGFLGISIHYGPLRYPEQYPAPGPEFDVNYGPLSIAEYLKFILESLVKGQTNPVYTWWIPTQADKDLFQILDEKGISLESPPEDWDREFVQPAQKTLEEIRAHYLGHLTLEHSRSAKGYLQTESALSTT